MDEQPAASPRHYFNMPFGKPYDPTHDGEILLGVKR
jgi:hypothetical protein